MQVFISYKREDQAFAERLRDSLHEWGYQPWLDIDNIEHGTYWPDEIDGGLSKSQVVIGVVTPQAIESRNVKNEWDWALTNKRTLLLLMLRRSQLPHRYVSLNWIDWERDEKTAREALQEALQDPDRPLYRDDAPPSEQPKPALIGDTNRARMLEKVRRYWIEGVLESALSAEEGFELGIELKPDAMLRNEDYADYALPTSAGIGKIFDDMGRELLILGAPGSGKTILLLQLARALIERAERDETRAIPVVFNLSSWAERRLPLDKWLVDELNSRYQVPRKLAAGWVDNEQLLLLLDALDEVQPEHREACAAAINEFRQGHRTVDLVVCSRLADYELLKTKLDLSSAIVLQPLSVQQIDTYLSQSPELTTLHSVLKRDPLLSEMVKTPFLLNTIAFTYRGMSERELLAHDTEAERYPHLFDHYVQRRFAQSDGAPYTLKQTREWLSWLAQQMTKHGQTVFQLDRLQPNWLDHPRVFEIVILIVGALLFALVIGLPNLLIVSPTRVLGIALGSGLGFAIAHLLRYRMPTWIAIVSAFALIFLILFGLSFVFVPVNPSEFYREIDFTAPGLLVSVFGIFVGAATSAGKFTISETYTWSTPRALRGLVKGAAIGIVLSLIWNLLPFKENLPFAFSDLITWGIPLPTSLFFGLFDGLRNTDVVARATVSDEGILRYLRAPILLGGALFVMIPALLFVSGLLPVISMRPEDPSNQFWTAIVFGLMYAVPVGLLYGGFALFQHFILRLLLYRAGPLPWNYTRFLDFCVARGLLRKVGGGYIFQHRLLLEYFADIRH